MFTQPMEMTRLTSAESYQMIQHEQLDSLVVSTQILAGSRIHLCLYLQIVFSDCIFYACNFQKVRFKNCVFDQCNFEFSHFKNCHFENCIFNNCTWKASSSTKSTYTDCGLVPDDHSFLENGHNRISITTKEDETTDISNKFLTAA